MKRNCFYNNCDYLEKHAIFSSIKNGSKRVAEAREYLNTLTNGKAMPALALTDNKSNVWEPVGEGKPICFC